MSKADVPVYTPFTVAKNLPPLPNILDPKLAESPFRHKSHGYDRSSTVADITYERLEFLGDAILGWVVADLAYRRFGDLPEGALTGVRKGVVNALALGAAAWLLDALDPADVEKAQQAMAASESVGQQRMSALRAESAGGSHDLEIAPNLWAGVGLVRGGAGTALVGSHEEVADRIEVLRLGRRVATFGPDTTVGELVGALTGATGGDRP